MRALEEQVTRLRGQSESLQARIYELEYEHRTLQGHDESYWALIRAIRETVRERVPADARIAVLTKGDDALVDLYGRDAWHFPRHLDGRYAGYYPKRDCSAIAHVEALRARGADFFLLPETSRWWLTYYAGFVRHLNHRYRLVVDHPGVCVIWNLGAHPSATDAPASVVARLLEDHTSIFGESPAVLDWKSGARLSDALPEHTVFSPPADRTPLPYLDATVDLVVIASDDRATIAEATRVAAKAVLNLGEHSAPAVTWLVDHEARLPSTSIVIPCHDGLSHTKACLTTLVETLPSDFAGEIIFVDDASSDGTQAFLARAARDDARIRLIRHDSNRGFVRACNRGARAAKGEYVLFLNNDTVLLPGWLQPILRTFRDFPDAGAVGGRLLFEDGRLQEAGGLVFSDGSAAKLGYYDEDPDAPLYGYVREVDYVSGALLATPREFFREVGGFDRRYRFGYYEDDDYCFAVRAAGRRVYYQPESTVVHVEGVSAGTDLTVGLKAFQVRNQSVFVRKWKDMLARQPARPDPWNWAGLVAVAGARR
jgi:GT2 family glycosyltransferase